jgi:TolB-like protein/DNA-binding SARP family transcriptional activator
VIDLRLFGRFKLTGRLGPLELSSAKLRALLAYLALLEPKAESRERLTALFWGLHFEGQASQNFRQALTRLRKVLGSEVVLVDDRLVRLSPGIISTDVRRFEALARTGSEADLREAVGLVDGELMYGIDVRETMWEEWLLSERRRVAPLVADALVALGQIEYQSGNANSALERGEVVIRQDFLREDAHRLVMRCLAKLGRRTEALKHFQGLSDRLKKELDTAPETETVQCCESLRRDTNAPAGNIAPHDPVPVLQSYLSKPSIAVLPFANLSVDPEQEYFADGMVEEIITALTRFHWLFVIAGNSSFAYKGRAVDLKQVGRELGVRYVLEGSVRKAANRVRILAQLADTTTGVGLWADRFEGELEDVFDLQDQVTARVVGAVSQKLEQAEMQRARRKPTQNLDAYDHYLRGLGGVHRWSRASNEEALKHFYRAIEIDPDFAPAYGMATRCYLQRKGSGWSTDRHHEIAETIRLAQKAIELGGDEAVALSTAGIALAFVVGDLKEGDALIERALTLNPNLAWAWLAGSWAKVWQGEPEAAIARSSHAMRLSPNDTQVFSMQTATSMAQFFAERYEQALACAERALREKPEFLLAACAAAASAAVAGRALETKKAMIHVLELDPGLRVSNLKELFPIDRSEHFARWAQGLQKAGLPD